MTLPYPRSDEGPWCEDQPTAQCSVLGCSQGCRVTRLGPRCHCGPGQQPAAGDTSQCEDTDECAASTLPPACDQVHSSIYMSHLCCLENSKQYLDVCSECSAILLNINHLCLCAGVPEHSRLLHLLLRARLHPHRPRHLHRCQPASWPARQPPCGLHLITSKDLL